MNGPDTDRALARILDDDLYDNPSSQPFERFPVLALWIERLANSRIEGMSLEHWGEFIGALNAALQSETMGDTQ